MKNEANFLGISFNSDRWTLSFDEPLIFSADTQVSNPLIWAGKVIDKRFVYGFQPLFRSEMSGKREKNMLGFNEIEDEKDIFKKFQHRSGLILARLFAWDAPIRFVKRIQATFYTL